VLSTGVSNWLPYIELNLEIGAEICSKNFIFETYLSFYVAPLSDNDSK